MSRGPEECGRPGAAGVAEWVPAFKYFTSLETLPILSEKACKNVFFLRLANGFGA